MRSKGKAPIEKSPTFTSRGVRDDKSAPRRKYRRREKLGVLPQSARTGRRQSKGGIMTEPGEQMTG